MAEASGELTGGPHSYLFVSLHALSTQAQGQLQMSRFNRCLRLLTQGSALGQLRNEREQASPMRAQTDSKPSLSAVNDSDGAGSIDHQMPQAELPLTPLHPSKVSCRGSSTSRASSEPSGTAVGASTRHSGSPNLLPSGDGGRAGPQVAAGPSSLQRHSLRETEAPPPSAQRFPVSRGAAGHGMGPGMSPSSSVVPQHFSPELTLLPLPSPCFLIALSALHC